ncbi:hypothetical protein CLAFUW4_04481 [Fulvia fulva]|uniref:Uncharacterized protein n=1 Tax=Passalora fulva TaxID=5499 RepID=A0A9Q8LF12_PASFU|nr:uncharacterized protein CLAFUR5_04446 [Fulvia fulva]KAK4626160.1 hypothetical protein CLAFUR4_04467 [Fulvia fulva]KAK4628297.1 hypothetical protein CLAFUR0_04470 [Fulvia fulva]UJO16280.1 hypothetical protein CLAFUR5_04446 [Fulvia fulva]WPV13459.1 hypothetical protein CLAFUW4_04481 [Fulvia fulva]WPV28887.1 hypothetical protein CLAFUW7_04473 [Fulvia fulva]
MLTCVYAFTFTLRQYHHIMSSTSPGVLLYCRGLPIVDESQHQVLCKFLLNKPRANASNIDASVYVPMGEHGITFGAAVVRLGAASEAQQVIDLWSGTPLNAQHRMFIDRADGSFRCREMRDAGLIDMARVEALLPLSFAIAESPTEQDG